MPDDEYIKVRVGPNRSATLRNIYSAVDERYTSGSVPVVQEPSDTSDEDVDSSPDSSRASSLDAGKTDGGLERETNDQGDGEPSVEPSGRETDEGAPGDPDRMEEPTGESEVEPSTVERTEPTGRPGSSEFEHAEYYGGPRSTIYGDSFY